MKPKPKKIAIQIPKTYTYRPESSATCYLCLQLSCTPYSCVEGVKVSRESNLWMNETFLGGENPMYKLVASLFCKLLLVFTEIEKLWKGKHLKFTIQYTYTKWITQIYRNCQRRSSLQCSEPKYWWTAANHVLEKIPKNIWQVKNKENLR